MTPSPPAKRFRILALDGGGIRGAFGAAFLARLERELKRPVADFFDLIVGTSTGGIIGIALALGESSETIRRMYEERGREIFTPRKHRPTQGLAGMCLRLLKRSLPAVQGEIIWRSKYSSDRLAAVLGQIYRNRTLGDATTARLVVPAINLTYGQTIVFKTPHRPNFVRDRHYKALDVALATTAAPTYFPPSSFANARFADGGLWANNPAIVGYAEAVKIQKDCRRPGLDPIFEVNDIWMLSIGTGEPEYYAKPGPQDDGLMWWGTRLFDVASGSQSQGAHFQAEYLLGKERYCRIDFKMPTNPWPLDEVAALPDLLHYGDQKAVEQIASLGALILAGEKHPYTPFD